MVEGVDCLRYEKRYRESERFDEEGELDAIYLKIGDAAYDWVPNGGGRWRRHEIGIPPDSRLISLEYIRRDIDSKGSPRKAYELRMERDTLHGEVYCLTVRSRGFTDAFWERRSKTLYERMRSRLEARDAERREYELLEKRDMIEVAKESTIAVEVYRIAKADFYPVGLDYYNVYGQLVLRKRIVEYDLNCEFAAELFEVPMD